MANADSSTQSIPTALSSKTVTTTIGFVAVAMICWGFADIAVTTVHPWQEMGRLFRGFVTPDLSAYRQVGTALLRTVAFAFTGVALGSIAGFFLALVFHIRLVRTGCAFVRAIHELFWALIFLQFFGLHPLTGVLAISIPYAGIFAKVYAEILEETDATPARVAPAGSGLLSVFVFARIPDAWAHLVTYTSYRLECGMRSSAVLGFVGLPTLGFYLESAFSQGHYSEVGALLLLFYVLIATLRIWVRPILVPLYIVAAPFFLGNGLPIVWSNVSRFFSEDIVPLPLRAGLSVDSLHATADWLAQLLVTEALQGIWNTVLLTQIALVATGLITLLSFPLISQKFTGPKRRTLGHVLLVIGRSTPEYILAYVLLQLWGPSMLPAVVALALHNGCIIGHLLGRQSNELLLRADAITGINRYFFELVPRLYNGFLAFLFYRWEIILRETAILGILGIQTLGFFIDSAVQDFRFDRALVLILLTAMLNIMVDRLSRLLRIRLYLKTTPTCER
jgi:phosphonate transport system permease protein